MARRASRRHEGGNPSGGGGMDATRVAADRDAAAREIAARMAAAAATWLDALDPAQRTVATGCAPSPDAESDAGYVTVATIIGLDNVLDHVEGWTVDWGRERGRDPGLYYLRVFGEPGGAAPWGWRFGGHHLSLNNLIAD